MSRHYEISETATPRIVRALPPAEPAEARQEHPGPAPLPKPAPGFLTLIGTIDLSEDGHTLDGHRYPGTAEGFDQFADEIERRAQALDDKAGLVTALILAARQSATVCRIAAGLGTSGAQVLVSASTTGRATGHPASLAALTRQDLLHEVREDGHTLYYRTPLGTGVARARSKLDATRRTDAVNEGAGRP